MGVHGLWELLAPVGRRVSVETLAGKRLAVDASIWMVQFMRAMRDDQGDMIRDAHLLGFLRRICKLLFLRARPVFVFDGATPALKRRTLAARRRHRDAAQAKVRKTAEKLLLSHLKARKLEELAAQIKSDRAKHDSKGKQVENSKREEVEKANIDQSKSDDGENSGGTVTPINQEKLDEMLAASLAAEEEADLIDKGKNHSASVPSQGAGITEDDDEDDDEMIFPMTMGDIDPAVLASLPPSMQLDLLVQMRERVMAENRQKYQKIKKEPAKFSELQIQSYLKTVAFRREIDEVQRCAAGKGVGGVQTSKIASEANREFIFSSSFTGDKQALAQRVGKEHIVDSVKSKKEINTAVFKSNPASSSRTKPNNGEPLGSFGPDVETYRDERGRIRVSRVRAMGIRMTRDIQRNLDFIKEHEQVKNKIHNTVVEGSTNNEEPPDFPEHLFESNELGSSLHLGEDFDETASDNHQTTSVIGGPDKISDGTYHGSKETIEISFVDDQTEVKDSDDQIFLHLVSGISSNLFTIDDRLPKSTDESDGPDCISKEGILQGETFPMEVDEKDHQDSLMDNRCTDDEIDWEEGGCDLPGGPSSNENNQSKVLKGDLEEDALIQEAIRRSLEDFENQEPENVTPEDLQSSLEDKFLQSYDDVPKPSGAAGKKYSHSEPALVTKTDDEIGKEINPDENDVANELLEADGHESENQTQPEDNKGQADMNRAYLLDTPPPCNTTTSTSASKSYSSEVQNDNDKVSVQNSLNSDNSKCITDDSYIGETSKSIQKGFLLDELVANTAIRNQNIAQKAMDDSISEINYTQLNDNVGIHNNLEKELSLLRQEQVYLGNERRKLESHAESVSSEMFAECQELLQMFGLPYIIAPMEAEAQCAYMEMNNLVDGVVTDDSDVFLFGARNVYKNIFDDRKYVETYLMKDIESELGLTREQLIRMALLLGSDYTEGISGIGIVNAIEVAHAFPEEDGLQKFREWVESPDPTLLGKLGMESVSSSKRNSDGKGSSQEPECIEGSDESLSSSEKQHIKEIFMSKHRNVSKNWHIPSTFPSESVINAYMSPQIDDSTEPFSWGRPDSSLLRKLCWERFGWSKEKADELFVPVLREYNKHETQLRMEAFYSFNERFAKIRSKRIKKAIKGITGKSFPETDELDQDRPNTSNASKKKERSTSGRGRAKGRRTKDATPENIGSQGHEIGDADSFADADGLTKENSAGSKKKNTNPCGPSRGKGRRRMNGAREIMGSQEHSELSNLASDEDSHKIHTNDYELEGFPLRRSNRKRKQVTYVEDGQQADDNDVSTHQINENQGQGSLEEDMGHMAGYDTQSNLFHQDTSQLNSDQMHTDPSDMNEDPSGFELQVDCQVDSAPKDYLFTGGGFCTEKGDDQDTAIDQSGAAREHGTSEDIDGVSDNNKNVSYCTGECTRNADTKAHGVSISQRHDATRASSAKPTVTKRGGKS